ncbi:alpha/beta fold hydrolase [Pseudonocardia sp. T1-2H]|uniref:alpha/beta fold hydrolase n=1 Tax=Pseudonocardia sp. T1-2H TaxID=3128899 RepID=UPI0031017C4A
MTTGDFQTHYIEDGSGDPVILLHGGGAGADSSSNWSTCLPLFGKRKRVIAMDMVGFGHTDKPDPGTFTYSQDARNSQVLAFIEELGLERVSIVGNSMGGATALGVAMRRPDLVENLVLMGSAGVPGDTKMSPALEPVMNYDFTLEGMRRIIAVLANPDYVASDEQIRYRYELSVKADTKAAYTAIMGWVRENGFGYSFDEIKRVKTRTLVVNGKDDEVVPIANAYKFLELLENSTGYLMPHCRHWAMIEYPDIFSSVALDFIDAYGADEN